MFDEMGVEISQDTTVENTDNYFGEEGVADLEEQQQEEEVQGETEEGLSVDNEVEQEETTTDDRVDNAFAKRLSKERAKLEQQYAPYISIMENEAKKYGMTTDEYVQALQEEMQKEEEYNRQRALKEEEERYSNLTPEEIEAIRWAKENKTKVEQEQQWLNDARILVEKFPEVQGVQDIPSEALDLYQKYNVPLVEAYDICKNKLNVKRTEIEQETIKNIKNNRNSSIGSLSNNSTEVPISISEMKREDFNTLVERVKRGEIRSL